MIREIRLYDEVEKDFTFYCGMEVASMTYARKNLISLQDTSYYHCVAQCVRRAWLWGKDDFSGKDYSHRKQWVVERLQQLTEY